MNAPFTNASFQVRQLAQYGRTDAAIPGTVTLMQMGEAGTPYASILTRDLVTSALAGGGDFNLLAGSGSIVFGFDQGAGAVTLSVVQGELQVSPSLRTSKLDAAFVNAASVTVNGSPVVTQAQLSATPIVSSFNFRSGDVQLELPDVLRAGGAPIRDAHFGGWITAPSVWDTRANDDTVATTNWVHRLLCTGAVTSFNGRTGNVILTTADVNWAYYQPGANPTAPSPVLGDSSNRIATTSFVDESIADAVFTGTPGAPGAPGAAGPAGPAGPAGAGFGVNINTLTSSPLVGDGVTSNIPQLQSLQPVMQSVGMEFPVRVTLTVGSPTVVTLNPVSGISNVHLLKPNQAFYFIVSSGGSLPSGITVNTPYYITSANMTATTFTFSATNNYGPTVVEGAPVNTTGSATGTVSIVLTGRDVNISIPPGAYTTGGTAQNLTPNGMSRVRYWAYGAIFDANIYVGPPTGNAYIGNAANWQAYIFDLVKTTPFNEAVPMIDGTITLNTIANAVNYFVGQWISIFGLDVQSAYNHFQSGPPNNQYHEYKRIKAINTSTGVITVDGPLKWVYLTTYPNLINTPPSGGPPASGLIGGGTALIAPMHPCWDMEVEVRGARWVASGVGTLARRTSYIDCVFEGYGSTPGIVVPSVSRAFIVKNCRFTGIPVSGYGQLQVDKMLEYVEFDNCWCGDRFQIQIPSVSLHTMLLKSSTIPQVSGSPRAMRISDCHMDWLQIGPMFGATAGVEIENSRVVLFDIMNRSDDSGSGTAGVNNDMQFVPNWTFSGGTFTRNISALPGNQPLTWQIPGAKLFFTDASAAVYKYFQNMGSPFTILNTYMDGSGNFSFDTTLQAVPTRQTQAAVTLTVASPGVVNWTAHGLAANTPVMFTIASGGTWPTGIQNSTIYYVSAPLTNSFNISATSGGGAINFTGTTSGAVTAYGNPLCFRIHPCPRFTGINNSGSLNLIDMNGAVDEPMFSRMKRAFTGRQLNSIYTGYVQPPVKIWGSLVSMTVNVVKAATTGTLNFNCPGFTQPNLTLSTFNQTIDLTQVGKRVITNTAVTGSLGTDVIAAYPDWIAGPMSFTPSAASTLINSALVLFEIQTDQGITRFSNMHGGPGGPAGVTPVWSYSDAGIVHTYGV